MSWKQWGIGEVVEAGDFQSFVQDQVVQSYANAAARGSALGTAVTDGMISFLQDGRSLSAYSTAAGAWVGIAPQSPNYIINGAFDIWQRGTSYTLTATDTYGAADRWLYWHNGSTVGTNTVSRQAFTPAELVANDFGDAEFYQRATVTTLGTSQTVFDFRHRVENVRTLAGQTATFSFWAKASTSLTLNPRIAQNFGSGGSATVTTDTNDATVTTSWQRFSFPITLPSISGKTIGSGNHLQVIIRFETVTAGMTLDVWGVQLESGSVATPFRRAANTLQGELAACQRYYVQYDPESTLGVGFGYCFSTTSYRGSFPTPVQMRAIPTLTTTGTIQIATQGVRRDPSTFSGFEVFPAQVGLIITPTTAFPAADHPATVLSNGIIALSAEL